MLHVYTSCVHDAEVIVSDINVSDINVREARRRLSSLLDRVERGEEVRITRNGKVVARLVPERPPLLDSQVLEDAERLRDRIRQAHGLRDNPVLTERDEARY